MFSSARFSNLVMDLVGHNVLVFLFCVGVLQVGWLLVIGH